MELTVKYKSSIIKSFFPLIEIILILTLKYFIDRIAPSHLCEFIEKQKSSANKRLANDAFF